MTGRKSPRRGGRRKGGGAPAAAGGQITIWGTHACREALANPARQVGAITLDRDPPDWVLAAIAAAEDAGASRPAPSVVARHDLQVLVPPQAVHQGIVLQVDPLPEPSLEEVMDRALARETALLLVLDQVEDPHNVGAIVRSAAAFGALAIIVQSRHAPPMGGTLFKAACGGCEHVPIVPVTNIARAVEALAREGISPVGLAEQAEGNLPGFEPPPRVAVVLGGEGPGLRRLVAESCERLLCLPTAGPIATLNVSNAAAIALYHIRSRQSFVNH